MLAPGQRVDRYEVEALVGQGGLAEVYRVRHTELGSVHALKILLFRKKSLDERLLLEGRIQAQLRHPNVVAVTDVVRHDGQVGLLMEYVDHISLDELIEQRGWLPLPEALELFAPVLAGVHAAHAAGVLHRDLKPANIMLARTAGGLVPKVADFGIAKVVDDDMVGSTREGTAMGTPGYMAPEQVLDAKTVDVRTDVFALGAILYELLTGRRAFADDAGEVTVRSTLEGTFLPLRDLVEEVPEHVDRAVSRALATDREARFPSVLEFAEALYADDPGLLPWIGGQVVGGGRPLSLDPARPSSYSDGGIEGRFGRGPTLAPAPGPTSSPTYDQGRMAEVSLSGQPGRRAPPPFWLGALVAGGFLLLGAAVAVLVVGPGIGLIGAVPVGPPTPQATLPTPRGTLTIREGDVLSPAPTEPAPDEAATAVPAPSGPAGFRTPRPTSGGGTPSVVPTGTPEPAAVPGTADVPPDAPVGGTGPAPPIIVEVEPPPGVAEPAPTVAAAAAPVMPMEVFLASSWQGKLYKQLFLLRLLRQQGADVLAEGRFVIGSNQRIVPLAGRFDPMSGNLLLRETNGDLVIQGRVDGATISGTYRREGKEGVEPLSLSRK
jgi:serine/threonine-protein kinase